jgi:hypothetical protein
LHNRARVVLHSKIHHDEMYMKQLVKTNHVQITYFFKLLLRADFHTHALSEQFYNFLCELFPLRDGQYGSQSRNNNAKDSEFDYILNYLL